MTDCCTGHYVIKTDTPKPPCFISDCINCAYRHVCRNYRFVKNIYVSPPYVTGTTTGVYPGGYKV